MPRGQSAYHRSFDQRGDAMLAALEGTGEDKRTLKQLAEAHKITVSRVTQIVGKARARRALREALAKAATEGEVMA